jgi:SecD/SecF fusion protein
LVLGGFIKVFGVVLSLSAIGAILLNIGMAVDANVIIYERLREELSKLTEKELRNLCSEYYREVIKKTKKKS